MVTTYDELTKRRRLENGNAIPQSDSGEDGSNDDMTKKYGIGAKLLLKMGYKKGQGLGREGTGISEPLKPEKRPVANAGLGAMSAGINDEEKSESDTSSSDEDMFHAGRNNAVDFKKTSVTFPSEEISQLEGLSRSLQVRCNISLPVNINQIDDHLRNELQNLGDELLEVQEQLDAVEHRIPLIEPELSALIKEEEQLQNIADLEPEAFGIRAKLILHDFDQDLADILFADLLYSTFKNFWSDWNPLDDSNEVLRDLQPLISELESHLELSDINYNRTQTVIYYNVIEKLIPFWKDFELNEDKINLIIHLVLEYQPIFKFMNCEKYLFDKYISNKLIEAMENWNIFDSDERLPPSVWYFDLSFLIADETFEKLERIMESKLHEYCDKWHHKKSSVIRSSDLIVIQELLGQEKFVDIIRTNFFPKFLDQLWDKYFDPVLELEDSSITDGSFYYYQKLHEYRLFFDKNDFETLVGAAFNELNKILYQWLLYADDQDLSGAQWWFNSFINNIFIQNDPVEVELKEIRRTLNFFQDSNALIHPIHIDRLDIREELNLAGHGKKYNVQNIPLTKVIPTFKDVLEDYCEQNGFVLEKTDHYAQLPQFINQDILVPVFKVHTGTRIYNVALRDNVLWVEKDKGLFIPTYLYELVP